MKKIRNMKFASRWFYEIILSGWTPLCYKRGRYIIFTAYVSLLFSCILGRWWYFLGHSYKNKGTRNSASVWQMKEYGSIFMALKEVDLGQGTQLWQIIGTFVLNILHQSHLSINVTWTNSILFQIKAWYALVKFNMIQTYHWFQESCPVP